MVEIDEEDGDLAQARHRVRVLEREKLSLTQELGNARRSRDLAQEKRLEAELAQAAAAQAVGPGWFAGGVTLVEAIQRKCTALEASMAARDAEVQRAVEAETGRIKAVILGGSFLHDEAPPAKWARELVAAIDRDTVRGQGK